MANKLDVQMNLPSDGQLRAMFDMVPKLQQYQVFDKVLSAGSRPIVAKAKRLAPDSSKTGSAKKRTDTQASQADWATPLRTTIALVVRKGKASGFSVIGPSHPKGNKVWLNASRKGVRRHILWGHDTGRAFVSIDNFIKRAFDETRAEQESAMKSKLKEVLDEVMKDG